MKEEYKIYVNLTPTSPSLTGVIRWIYRNPYCNPTVKTKSRILTITVDHI